MTAAAGTALFLGTATSGHASLSTDLPIQMHNVDLTAAAGRVVGVSQLFFLCQHISMTSQLVLPSASEQYKTFVASFEWASLSVIPLGDSANPNSNETRRRVLCAFDMIRTSTISYLHFQSVREY